MGIDEPKIRGQLESLERQEQILIGQLSETRGAQRLCRHWLGDLARQRDEAAQATVEPATEPAVN